MKLFQKILSHGLLIAFFVAVFFLYLYRVDLFPQWFGEEAQRVAVPAAGTGTAAPAAEEPSTELAQVEPAAQEIPEDTTPQAPVAEGGEALPTPAGEPPAPEQQLAQAELPPVVSSEQPAPAVPAGGPVSELPPLVDVAEQAPETQAGAGVPELPPVAGVPDQTAPQQPGAAVPELPPVADVAEQAPTEQQEAAPSPAPPSAAVSQEPGAPAQPAARWTPPVAGAPPAQYRPMEESTGAPTGVAQPLPAAQEPGAAMSAPEYRPEQPPKTYRPAPPRGAPPGMPQPWGAAPQQAASAEPAAAAAGVQLADYEQRLATARTRFWERDMEAAVQAYQSLTEAYPDRADAWGEFGNVNFKLGHWAEAAEAYYRAVSLLIERGDAERARHLLRVLHGLDAEKAGELETRLRNMGG